MNRATFETIATAIRPRLHRFCTRMTRSVVDGEDLVQDTLARAFDRLDTLQDDRRVEAWLFRIAYTRCLNARRGPRHDALEPDDEAIDPIDPIDPIERAETLGAALTTLVARLPTKERAAVILKDVLDYSLKDTAEIIDSTEGGVKAALHRARAKLRTAEPEPPLDMTERRLVAEYLARFNRRDWDGVKALVRDDVHFFVVGRAEGTGPAFLEDQYSTNYEKLPFEWRYEIVDVDGAPLAVLFRKESGKWIPNSALSLEFQDGLVKTVRDYIHVDYLLVAANVAAATDGVDQGRPSGDRAPQMVKTQTFEKKTADGAIPLVISAAEGSSLPGLVVVPSIFGVGEDLVAQMETLAASAIVVAMDPFWRVKPGPLSYAEPREALERMQALDVQACFDDVRAVLRWTKNHPRSNGHVAILGICFGGPFALMAAANQLVDGVATWHGSRMQHFLERADEMSCPMTLHFGEADAVVPPEAVESVRRAFADREDVTIAVHPNAAHGFSHRGNVHFDEAAERAAMSDVSALLAHLA